MTFALQRCTQSLWIGHRHTLRRAVQAGRLRRYAGVRDIPFSCLPPAYQDRSPLDRFIISRLIADSLAAETEWTQAESSTRLEISHLPTCSYRQYRENANIVLPSILPYEPYPPPDRRADNPAGAGPGQGDGLVLVVHAVLGVPGGDEGEQLDFTVCSGFVVQPVDSTGNEGPLIVTCSHTLEEIHIRHPTSPVRTYFILPSPPTQPDDPHRSETTTMIPVANVPTSLPRLDLLVLRPTRSAEIGRIRSLPVSPFPIYRGQEVLAHLFGSPEAPQQRRASIISRRSVDNDGSGGRAESTGRHKADEAMSPLAWPEGLGWRRWVKGRMLGYRGDLWEEVEPGTADSLPYILTSPLPTPGSSGGPILDASSGAVVGVISGTRMDNRVEGERGWGASAENIFELFSLPGFIPASAKNRQGTNG